MGHAREGQSIDVGAPAVGPLIDVVDFGQVTGHVATGRCAAAVFRVQHDSLIGGGNAEPNFMGRIWTNNILINGNTKVRTPVTNPSFCAIHRCPPPAKIPLYDMIARSFSHASGF